MLETETRSGVVLGTLLYLSPEQATGDPVDPRSDIFALGVLLYESITGQAPFSGKNAIEIVAEVIHFNPPPPSSLNANIPKELDRISLKASLKNPVPAINRRVISAAIYSRSTTLLKTQPTSGLNAFRWQTIHGPQAR